MVIKFRKLYKILLTAQLLIGILLLTSNLIGFFDFKQINDNLKSKEATSDPYPSIITASQFWETAYRSSSETTNEYAARLTGLISRRMTNIYAKYMNQRYPTFPENWILWLWSIKNGRHEYIDTFLAVRNGMGYCSQHAIILNNIMREQRINSRIISINGHVLNEIYIPEKEKWQIFDPDYNVTLPFSLQECENPDNSQAIVEEYRNAGFSKAVAEKILHFFLTNEDNYNFKTSQAYQSHLSCIESLSLLFIWLIPLILILNSLPPLLLFYRKNKNRS